jgi:hypothetical protein
VTQVLLRDDKFYPYICVSLGERLPRVFSVPRKLPRTPATAEHRYFGPYTDRSQLRRALALLEQAFRLRRLRFEARYGDDSADEGPGVSGARDKMPAEECGGSELLGGGEAGGEIAKGAGRASAALEDYGRAVDRCVRVLEGRLGEVICEMEAEGSSQQTQPLRALASSLSSEVAALAPALQTGNARDPGAAMRGELDFLGWDHAPDAPALDVVAFERIPLDPSALEGGGDRGEGAGQQVERGDLRAEVEAVVLILKVRQGCVTGRYVARVAVPVVVGGGAGGEGRGGDLGDEEIGEAMLGVMYDYYLAADLSPADIPQVVLTQVSLDAGVGGGEGGAKGLRELLERRAAAGDPGRRREGEGEGASGGGQAKEVATSSGAARDVRKVGGRGEGGGRGIEVRSLSVPRRAAAGRKGGAAAAAKVPIKRVGRLTEKQRARDRDARAVQLAHANAQAEAARIAEERRGWARAATDLQALLHLPPDTLPERIECYDISHLQGAQTVASRVVFVKGVPAKDLYRSYNIRSSAHGDDYAAMSEVISRRFRDMGRKASADGGAESWPDVVVVDGGKGQLAAAFEGLEFANVPASFRARVCALAKKHEDIYVGDSPRPLDTDADQPALLLLRAVRDESHRFAVSRHRRARSKALFQ